MHRIAASMPHVNRVVGPQGNPIYQVGGKSFVYFRTRGRTRPTRTPVSATPTSSSCGWSPRPTSWP
ncbi:hypothetical protein I547_2875 [Mycobacterium kansasii 824]|nr:hypothetical protein I547_2875 [Mycobacterium kansasii 824]